MSKYVCRSVGVNLAYHDGFYVLPVGGNANLQQNTTFASDCHEGAGVMSSVGLVSSVVSSILSHNVPGNLKGRDAANKKWDEIIEEHLNALKRKIDVLARKDLLASHHFLKQGVVSFSLALEEANGAAKNDGTNATTTNTESESQFGVLNQAIELTHAIQWLDKTPDSRFARAKDCFVAARKEATRAFYNETLDLQDRIMAAKIRVVSTILESLHDTKLAAIECLLYLEELHNLPAIGQAFSVYFKGGIRSLFNKVERLEIVKSVLALNFGVYEFIARFSGELPDVKNWPRIHLSTKGETLHPLLLNVDDLNKIFDKALISFELPKNHVSSDQMDNSRIPFPGKEQSIIKPSYSILSYSASDAVE